MDQDQNSSHGCSSSLNDESSTILTPRNITLTQNATNAHPLMESPVSPDFPDLIPEKPKTRSSNHDKLIFKPEAHSSELDLNVTEESFEGKLNFSLGEYSEKLPGRWRFMFKASIFALNAYALFYAEFPESPSILKKSLMFDLPVEVNQSEMSDTENDVSIYEAHLSSNFQNVALTMNEKQGTLSILQVFIDMDIYLYLALCYLGNLNFLAHKKQSNKLRKVRVVQIEASPDSDDVSSLDSNTDSLKSEDVFTEFAETKAENEQDTQDGMF